MGEKCFSRAEIKIWLSRKVMEAVHSSLLPETKLPSTGVKLKRNRTLHIKVVGEDLSDLRAALNSILRWMSVAVEVIKSG
jgi:tRNA threonylcarbamoyladenosine modification (KEOPS) complex  Pcc1 subunit